MPRSAGIYHLRHMGTECFAKLCQTYTSHFGPSPVPGQAHLFFSDCSGQFQSDILKRELIQTNYSKQTANAAFGLECFWKIPDHCYDPCNARYHALLHVAGHEEVDDELVKCCTKDLEPSEKNHPKIKRKAGWEVRKVQPLPTLDTHTVAKTFLED